MRQHPFVVHLISFIAIVFFIVFSVVFALTSSQAIAADGVDGESARAQSELETITVTASRTPTELRESGSSVSIISRQDILLRGATNLAELLREIPGMAVSQQGAVGNITQVRVRGAEANQVLVLIDGVEANDVAQGSEFNFAHLLTSQVQRIEIVRGPQSALWGSDALAGVINVITRPAIEGSTGGLLSLASGSSGTLNASAGMDFHHSNGTVRLSAERLYTEGTNISRHGDETDGYRNTTIGVAGQWDLSDNAALAFTARHTDVTTEYDGIDFVTTGLPEDADYETDSDQQYARVGLTFGDPLRPLRHQLTAFRSQTENINRTLPARSEVSRGTHNHISYQADYQRNQHVVSGVIEFETERYEQRGPATPFGDPNKDLETQTRSVASEYRFDGEQADLSLSLRYDANEAFDDALTWRLTSAWHMSETTSAFASMGRSVKNPTFTERFGYFDTFTGNPDLKPETSLGWEIGLRQTLPDDGGQFQASWFEVRLDDEINSFVFDPALGGFTATNTSGKSERTGVELQMSLEISERATARAQYTWLDATEQNPAGTRVTEVRRPTHGASTGLELTMGATTMDVAVVYTGSQEDDYFPPVPPYQTRVKLPGRTLVNLSLVHRLSQGLSLTASVRNVFDKRYEEVYGFASPGISAYAGVRMAF